MSSPHAPPDPRRRNASGATEASVESQPKQAHANRSTFVVVIVNGKKRGMWDTFPNRERAEAIAHKLRRHGLEAVVEREVSP